MSGFSMFLSMLRTVRSHTMTTGVSAPSQLRGVSMQAPKKPMAGTSQKADTARISSSIRLPSTTTRVLPIPGRP